MGLIIFRLSYFIISSPLCGFSCIFLYYHCKVKQSYCRRSVGKIRIKKNSSVRSIMLVEYESINNI